MRILCVIPVRGGSKGIPRKNLRPIAGKPLVAWTIEQALAAKEEVAGEHELRVVVSTDDAELADIAREYGAEVPFIRPAHLAEDTTATEPVIEHAIEFYTENGWEPEAVMLLQATSPVRLRVGVCSVQGAGLQGCGRVSNQPTTEVAVRERTAQDTGLVHQEDDALAVSRNLLQCVENRVFSEDHVGGNIAFNNHDFDLFV